MGRPPYQPTDEVREQVRKMAGLGLRESDICSIIKITAPTLRKYYADDLAIGRADATYQVAQSLFRQAVNEEKPSMSAAIFYLKCQAGWRENPETQGKKEKQQAAAEEQTQEGNAFAPMKAPRLVRDNTQ